jgi:hypothetical protein
MAKKVKGKAASIVAAPPQVEARVDFALPAGWTYSDPRQFLDSEIEEDDPLRLKSPTGYGYMYIRDFDDERVIVSNGNGTLYSIPYALTTTDAGTDVEWDAPGASEVVSRTTYQSVADFAVFTLDGEGDTAAFDATAIGTTGDYVVKRGKIGEVGDWPDKGFSLTAEEAAAAVAAFAPVKNKGAHVPTIFDGAMGYLAGVSMAEDGTTIIGEVAIPKWLADFNDAEMGGAPFQASLEWHKPTKTIVGNTLIPNPRIADSALFSSLIASFAGRRHSATDQGHVQAAHDATVKAGAVCKTGGTVGMSGSPGEQKGTAPMAQTAGTGPAEAARTASGEGGEQVVSFADYQALVARNEASAKRLAALERERDKEKATALVDGYIAAFRMLPGERDANIVLFEQAIREDRENGVVNFDDGTTGTRAALLKASFDARIPHGYTREQMPDGELLALMTKGQTGGGRSAINEQADKTAREYAEKMNRTENAGR